MQHLTPDDFLVFSNSEIEKNLKEFPGIDPDDDHIVPRDSIMDGKALVTGINGELVLFKVRVRSPNGSIKDVNLAHIDVICPDRGFSYQEPGKDYRCFGCMQDLERYGKPWDRYNEVKVKTSNKEFFGKNIRITTHTRTTYAINYSVLEA